MLKNSFKCIYKEIYWCGSFHRLTLQINEIAFLFLEPSINFLCIITKMHHVHNKYISGENCRKLVGDYSSDHWPSPVVFWIDKNLFKLQKTKQKHCPWEHWFNFVLRNDRSSWRVACITKKTYFVYCSRCTTLYDIFICTWSTITSLEKR